MHWIERGTLLPPQQSGNDPFEAFACGPRCRPAGGTQSPEYLRKRSALAVPVTYAK